MIRLGRMTDYAVVVMSDLSRHHGTIRTTSDVVRATGLPLPTVSKVLHQLSALGLLGAVRGRHGGYRMLRRAEDISVAEIIAGFEGPLALADCLEGAPGACDLEARCPVVGRWRVVSGAIERVLREVTLADVLGGAPRPAAATPAPTELTTGAIAP